MSDSYSPLGISAWNVYRTRDFAENPKRDILSKMKAKAAATSADQPHRIPPFLKKLVDMTDVCPADVGGWSEDGSQFVIKSSRFADIVRDRFDITLETFIRQLQLERPGGHWAFSHPQFRRGRQELLANIRRKEAPRQKPGAQETRSDDTMLQAIQRSLERLESRTERMEAYLNTINLLVQESAHQKQQIQALERRAAAENLLALGPELAKDRALERDASRQSSGEDPIIRGAKGLTVSRPSLSPPVPKIMRMDSELRLPTSNLESQSDSSASFSDMSQNDFFLDFEQMVSQLPMMHFCVESDPGLPFEDNRGNCLPVPNNRGNCLPYPKLNEAGDPGIVIPENFQLLHGATAPLLKQVFMVIKQELKSHGFKSCPCYPVLKKIVRELPHPSTLGSYETCQFGREMLPLLRETFDESTPDLTLICAVRHIYELRYATKIMMREQAQSS